MCPGWLTRSLLAAVFVATAAIVEAQVAADSPRANLLNLAAQTPDPTVGREQILALATYVALEVSTAPLGTSSGAFTFTFDDGLGVFTRSSSTFGPSFAERSLTSGKGKLSTGLNWLHADYDSLAGMDADDGSLRAIVTPLSYGTNTVDISSDTVVAFGTYGITDNFDIGASLPFVRVSAGAGVQFFLNTQAAPVIDVSVPAASASGLGDMALFGKYRLWRKDEGGLAAQVELRLPTGDEDGLRGLGVSRTHVSAIYSHGGRISPHANIGYEFWSDDVVLNERFDVTAHGQVRYAFGAEFQAHPRVTANLDFVGRRLLGGGKPEYIPYSFPDGTTMTLLVAGDESLDVISFAPGAKWNIGGTLLVTGSLVTSLKNDGLSASVVPVFGLDWAF